MRLPAADLTAFVPAILEGILLWAEDSKNKFRLKVRVVMERLARRCGFEVLEKAVPEAHRALLTHIRKQHNRKERRRPGATEMEWDGGDDEDGRTVKSGAARTARTGRTAARSAWNSDVFSDEEEDGRATTVGGRTAKTAGGASARRGIGAGAGRSVRSAPQGPGGARGLPSSEDPLDLLDVGTARKMVRGGGSGGGRGGGAKAADDDINFDTGKDGRMVILEERPVIGKRKRGEAEDAGFDSDDSDFEDLKGFTGLKLALKGSKSVAAAPTIAASIGAKSMGARTAGGRSTKSGTGGRGSHHSGDRFKSKKAAGGDVKGSSKVEPYAYWPLDRKLMNRRASKTRTAKAGLDKVVAANKAGAAKGLKAKRARR
jgi:ribosomal RNA-processing protein 12